MQLGNRAKQCGSGRLGEFLIDVEIAGLRADGLGMNAYK
jgi:hypothetical protein